MEQKMERLIDFIEEKDADFAEKIIEDLTDEELSNFLKENPDFIKENL